VNLAYLKKFIRAIDDTGSIVRIGYRRPSDTRPRIGRFDLVEINHGSEKYPGSAHGI